MVAAAAARDALRMRGRSLVLGALLLADARAQAAPFDELRRWHWQGPEVLCAANDAAGTAVAYAIDDGAGGWMLVHYDPIARRDVARWPVPRKPMALRWAEPGVVDVRERDSDRLLSWSHWHHVRLADGQEFGEPVNFRVADEDPVAHRRMKGDDGGIDPHVYRNGDGGLSWSQPDSTHAITDGAVRDLVLTPDGRYAVVLLPSRLVVVPVGGGDATELPFRADQVLAIVAGGNGDEVVVVANGVIHLVRCSAGAAMRSVTFRTTAVPAPKPMAPARLLRRSPAAQWVAALQPGGRRLAIVHGGGGMIVDLDDGGTRDMDGTVQRVAWAPDGRTLLGSSPPYLLGLDEGGGAQWQTEQRERNPFVQKYGALMLGDWNLLAINGDRAAVCSDDDYSVCYSRAGPEEEARNTGHRLRGRLADGRWVATRGSLLLVCDPDTWLPMHTFDAGAKVGSAAVTPASRRIAAVVGGDVVVFALHAGPDAPR